MIKKAVDACIEFLEMQYKELKVEFSGLNFRWTILPLRGAGFLSGLLEPINGEDEEYVVSVYKRTIMADIVIGLHPQTNDIRAILLALKTEALPDPERNMPPEALLRTFIRAMKVKGVKKVEALDLIIDALHIKANIDEIYRQGK